MEKLGDGGVEVENMKVGRVTDIVEARGHEGDLWVQGKGSVVDRTR